MTAQLGAVPSSQPSHLFSDALQQGFNVSQERATEIAATMRRPFCFTGADYRDLSSDERITVAYHLLKEYMPDSDAWELAHIMKDEVSGLTFTRYGSDRFYSLIVGLDRRP